MQGEDPTKERNQSTKATTKEKLKSIGKEIDTLEKELKESYVKLLKRRCDFLRKNEENNRTGQETEEESVSIEKNIVETESLIKELIGEEAFILAKRTEIDQKLKEYKEGRERIVELCKELNNITKVLRRLQREVEAASRTERRERAEGAIPTVTVDDINDLYLEIEGTTEQIQRREAEIGDIVYELDLIGVNL